VQGLVLEALAFDYQKYCIATVEHESEQKAEERHVVSSPDAAVQKFTVVVKLVRALAAAKAVVAGFVDQTITKNAEQELFLVAVTGGHLACQNGVSGQDPLDGADLVEDQHY